MKEMPDPWFCRKVYLLPDSIHFFQIVRVLPDCILFPSKPSFSNSPALSPSPPRRKLIHLYSFKNTTLFPAKNPANPPKINLSAREARRFPHGGCARIGQLPPPFLAHNPSCTVSCSPLPECPDRSSHK